MTLVRNCIINGITRNRILLRGCSAIYKTKRSTNFIICRCKSDKPTLSSLVVPIKVEASNNSDDVNIGAELTGTELKRQDIITALNELLRRQPVRQLAASYGIDTTLFHQCFQSFRTYCLGSKVLPPELHIKLVDILHGHGNVDDLFPDFLKHSREVFPHLECLDELRNISDLSQPVNWYPEARKIERKIIFHAGPTNSGKTYHALKRFTESKSGIYCAPLKLLAVEVKNKTNELGTKCDLITGEERYLANEDGTEADHVACTVEMACTKTVRDVAVIDEIQMIRDSQRGWAWTRAILGIPAKEIHLCGEEAALDLIREILSPVGEDVEVERYKRLTPLVIEDQPLGSLENVRNGDCIVCFSKKDIFTVSHHLENLGHDVAVIYGSLPPATKVLQTQRFNDPNDPCNILVATDAIGMGLNLSIRRVIFYSMKKPVNNEKGDVEVETIPTSAALQIAGRAGRFNTKYSTGYVTTFLANDLLVLKDVLAQPVDPIATAGLHPTMEQIEMFAYNLPKATFSNLFDIFLSICKMDTSCYFMCNIDNIKFLADLIQHVPLSLRTRYIFCHAPINLQVPFISTMFLKFARQFSQNEPITIDWLFRTMQWPFTVPRNIAELVHLEAAFDVLDLYLWLSYRFPDLFPDNTLVREMQRELDALINKGIQSIKKIVRPAFLEDIADNGKTQLVKKQPGRRKISKDEDTDGKKNKVVDDTFEDLTSQFDNIDISESKVGSNTTNSFSSSIVSPKCLKNMGFPKTMERNSVRKSTKEKRKRNVEMLQEPGSNNGNKHSLKTTNGEILEDKDTNKVTDELKTLDEPNIFRIRDLNDVYFPEDSDIPDSVIPTILSPKASPKSLKNMRSMSTNEDDSFKKSKKEKRKHNVELLDEDVTDNGNIHSLKTTNGEILEDDTNGKSNKVIDNSEALPAQVDNIDFTESKIEAITGNVLSSSILSPKNLKNLRSNFTQNTNENDFSKKSGKNEKRNSKS